MHYCYSNISKKENQMEGINKFIKKDKKINLPKIINYNRL